MTVARDKLHQVHDSIIGPTSFGLNAVYYAQQRHGGRDNFAVFWVRSGQYCEFFFYINNLKKTM